MVHPFKLPKALRKGIRGPLTDKTEVNTWVVGRHRAMKLIASAERAGHQSVVADLNCIQRTAKLSVEQAKAVAEELAWRKGEIKYLTRVIDNCQRGINQQYEQAGTDIEPADRIADMVAGPQGHKANSYVKNLHHKDGLVHGPEQRARATLSLTVTATSHTQPLPAPALAAQDAMH